ncbi:hypothetical protein [Candidatus Photodesmus katoptron]|uniref:hypothetical protein n=1 Tax=Candidatus Photodesmus anomalopis TaxID=28176 RepID=UPI0012DDAE83|nr:hypothetical protein [Candidatus Photodesmus katoptron]
MVNKAQSVEQVAIYTRHYKNLFFILEVFIKKVKVTVLLGNYLKVGIITAGIKVC